MNKGYFIKRSRLITYFPLFIIAAIVLTSYNNCGRKFTTQSEESSESGQSSFTNSSNICEDSLHQLFSRGYYQFVRTQCTTCHASDPDKPQFASSDIKWAFESFMDRGYTKISDNAISANHQPPYTGPQHIQNVNELRLEWQQGLQEYDKCSGNNTSAAEQIDPATKLTIQTVSKIIPPLQVDEEAQLIWDISTDFIALTSQAQLPQLPGTKISIQVRRHLTAGGQDYYSFYSPKIINTIQDVHVKTLYLTLNGLRLKYPSTFKYMDVNIRAGSKNDSTGLLSTGGLTAPGVISSADNLSLSFELIEGVILPPPKPPIQVNFEGGQVYFVDSSTQSIDLPVSLTEAPLDRPVTFSIEEESIPLCGGTDPNGSLTVSSSCLPMVYQALCAKNKCDSINTRLQRARSISGTGSFNRFDWDYKYKSFGMTVSGLNQTGSISVKISSDVRKEDNRLLRLNIVVTGNAAQPGSNSKVYLVFLKTQNPTPKPTEVTYSRLMTSKGVFGQYCLKCHNSRDLNGGYDITNYELMIQNRVLVPFNVQSKMYRRLKANDPEFINLSPMPVEGFLDTSYTDVVLEWILNGAKNN